jgi:LmbE family N-acetylglucosaminyl deacetylase
VPTVLHVAPHPDDEAIGAVATVLGLRDAGWRVVVLAGSPSRVADRERRRGELDEACRRAGFELADGGLERVADLARGAGLIVSPSPHDRHPRHEEAGRAARDAVRGGAVARWWMWSLWGELPLPTLFSGFDDAMLARARHVLAAHAGELARNDYGRLLGARAAAAAILGAERVFGWGSPGRPDAYAELLTEVRPAGGALLAGPPRVLDRADPVPNLDGGEPLDWWLDAPSFTARMARSPRAPRP